MSGPHPQSAADSSRPALTRTAVGVGLLSSTLPALLAGRLFLPGLIVPASHLVVTAALGVAACAAWLMPVRRHWRRVVGRSAAFSLAVILAISYPAAATLFHVRAFSGADSGLGAAWLALTIAGPWLAVRAWSGQEQGVLLVAGVLTLFSTAATVSGPWTAYARGVKDWSGARHLMTAPIVLGAPSPADPDIVHILLDGMGRRDVLQYEYGMEDRVFDDLARSGLQPVPDAVANYAHTYQALAAMLNARYLDPVATTLADEQDRRPLVELVHDSAVVRSLKARGYSFVLVGTGFDMTEPTPLVDTCVNCGPTIPGLFETALLSVTPFRALAPWHWFFEAHHRRIESSLDYLRHLRLDGSRPTYVFAHILLPHPPFLMSREGRRHDPPGAFDTRDEALFLGSDEEYRRGYADQASYTLEAVAAIAARLRQIAGSRRVVIVVNGDHGPGLHFDRTNLSERGIGGRMAILLAIAGLPRDVAVRSPVNIYRELFAQLFGASLTRAPDRSLIDRPGYTYRFTEVTGDAALSENGLSKAAVSAAGGR